MGGQRKALIVASDQYENEGLQALLAPAADAEALRAVLSDPQIGDFDVNVVQNESSHRIMELIDDVFSDSHTEDTLLLHFSCHGLKNDAGELFFAARNTRPDRLDSTAIPANFVQGRMLTSRARRIVLLLDCCYGGAFPSNWKARAPENANVLDSFPQAKLGGGRGWAVITASGAMGYAFEGDQLAAGAQPQPSLFTSALVEGMRTGDADRDGDGRISLTELYDYIFDNVRDKNPKQTPSRRFELEGELYLARSRLRRIIAAALPPMLDAALQDPSMYARRGVVSELRTRLRSDNLPVAAGAWKALVTLAADVSYVAEAAQAALRDATVEAVPSELDFGQVEQDSGPHHRTVQLLGPPLARSHTFTFEASQSWIRVRQVPEGIDVSVNTSRPGDLRGDIAIKGQTGEAVIAVRVEVTASPAEPQEDAATTPAAAEKPAQAADAEPQHDSPDFGIIETDAPMDPAEQVDVIPNAELTEAALTLVTWVSRSRIAPNTTVTWTCRVTNSGLVAVYHVEVTKAGAERLHRPFDLEPAAEKEISFEERYAEHGGRMVITATGRTDGGVLVSAEDAGRVRVSRPAPTPQASSAGRSQAGAKSPAKGPPPGATPAPSRSTGWQLDPLSARPSALPSEPGHVTGWVVNNEPLNVPRFREAMRQLKATADIGDTSVNDLIHLIDEGEYHYRVATGRSQRPADWQLRIDAWNRAVASRRSADIVLIKLEPLAAREIVDNMQILASELAERTRIKIPVDEFH